MIKSPLRYPGGKSRAIKILYPLIPANSDMFLEPFAGGASLGIYVSQNKDIPVLMNDINYDVYCFWKYALNDNQKLVEKVINYYNMPKNKETYLKIVSENFKDKLDIAARFFALNRITFSGTIESGGYSKEAHNKRFTESSINRLKNISNLKNKITVFNDDYETFLKNNLITSNPIVFLDPPYYSATKSALYGKNGNYHKKFDHYRLNNFLKNSNFKFFMTYDNCDFIKNLYKDFYIYEWSLQYGMTNKKSEKNNELIITNYKYNGGRNNE